MSLLIRNLFFSILQPGIVAGFIPYLILRNNPSPNNYVFVLILVFFIFCLGIFLLIWSITMIGKIGRGTLSPLDPTKKLVTTGPYQYSRNPMYVGVLLMLIAYALHYNSMYMLLYFVVVFLMFACFVLTREEPRLKKEFGSQYSDYSQKVRRWL